MRALPLIVTLCLSMGSSASGRAGGEPAPSCPPPPWQELNFEQTRFFVTARASIAVRSDCSSKALWIVNGESSLAGNGERLVLVLNAPSGAAVTRTRLGQGKNQRLKSYLYRDNYILRTRSEPAAGQDADEAAAWPQTSEHTIDTSSSGDAVLTTPTALLLLASVLAEQPSGSSAQVRVNTDHNLYRVDMTNAGAAELNTDFKLATTTIAGVRAVNTIELVATAIAPLADKPDFDVLGLGVDGRLQIHVDRELGLPVQVSGEAPRVGNTDLKLTAAQR